MLIHTAGNIHVIHVGSEIWSSLSHWQNLDEEKRKMTGKKAERAADGAVCVDMFAPLISQLL